MTKPVLSPLSKEIDQYTSKGYSVIPIAPKDNILNGKSPGIYEAFAEKWILMPGWQRFADNVPSPMVVGMWKGWPESGLGFPCGGINRIVALDFQQDKDGLHQKIENIAGYSPCQKRGLNGFTAFYRMNLDNPETSRNWVVEGVSVVELLSKGRQTVLPPTIHPEAKLAYEWRGATGKALHEYAYDDLPCLPPDFVKQVDLLFNKPEVSGLPADYFYDDPSHQEILDAISHINPDCSYEQWIKMGMALQKQLGQTGYRVWQDWSAKGGKYKGVKDCEVHWRNFKQDGTVSIRTLFRQAKLEGYKPVMPAQRLFSDESVDADGVVLTPEVLNHNLMLGAAGKSTADENFTDYDPIINPPSPLMRAMQDWLLTVAVKPQPVYAVAATIAALGVLFGHKIKSPTNLRTNMFCITLGASGSGKDSSMKAIDSLFNVCGINNLIGGTPKSGPAIISSLADTQGKKLYQLDEFGIYLGGITSNNSQAYQNEIMSNFMRLFSSAGGIFKGDEYANKDGKTPRKDLNNPHLCVNGVTTPVRFWESLASKHTVDGFLSRFLVFESDLASPEMQMPQDIYDPPAALVDYVMQINAMPINVGNDPKEALRGIIRPLAVRFTDKANAHMNEFAAYCDKQKTIEYAKKGAAEAIWARAYEHAVKLAMCCYHFQDMNLEIAEWATMTAKICINRCILGLEDNISDSVHESDTKKLFVVIRTAGANGLSKTELARRTQWMNSRQRNSLLEDLKEQNRVEEIKRRSGEKGTPVQVIRVLDL